MSLHELLYFGYVALAALLVVFGAYALVRRNEPPAVTVLLAATVAVGLAGLATRSAAAGHLPIFGTFENTYTSSWFLLAAALLGRTTSWWRRAWLLAAPWAAALLVYGAFFRSEVLPLTISELSWWVDVHVALAWLAFVPLLAAGTLGLAIALKRAPDQAELDLMETRAVRLVGSGFIIFSAMLAIGSWYLYVLFGEFWRWEIVETLSLIVWLECAIIAHGRLFWRWQGRTLGLWLLALLVTALLAYWVWSVFPGTYHYFDIPLLRSY